MITKHHSWSLGATPNKSLDSFGALICSHSQSDPIGAAQLALSFFQAFCTLTSAFCVGQNHLLDDRLLNKLRDSRVPPRALPWSLVSPSLSSALRNKSSLQKHTLTPATRIHATSQISPRRHQSTSHGSQSRFLDQSTKTHTTDLFGL